MGTLTRQPPGGPAHLQLCRTHSLGRDAGNYTILQGLKISRWHARVYFRGDAWMVRDMGSRNGSYVNGRRVPEGRAVRLKVGDRLVFGDVDESWTFSDDSRPRSLLIPIADDASPITLDRVTVLPSPEQPGVTIFLDAEGGCLAEHEDGHRQIVEHGDRLVIGGCEYMVHLDVSEGNNQDTKTADALAAADVARALHLRIDVAPDEERAAVTLCLGSMQHELGPRVHLYLLAHLARARKEQTSSATKLVADADDGCGWVDCESVCKALSVNREHLAQMVFRVRQDFEAIHSDVARTIIDRQLRGRIRIGTTAGQMTINRL